MSKYKDFYSAREKIFEIVKSDLIGPVETDEVLNEAPTSYYIMGKLYPMTSTESTADDNTTSADLESVELDNSLATTNLKEPGAMGITFTVTSDIERVKVKLSYAFYKPYTLSEAQEKEIDIERYSELIAKADDKEKDRMRFWKRQEKAEEFDISLLENSKKEIESQLVLKSYLHNVELTGERIITVVLINERKVLDEDRNKVAENAFFQPEIRIEAYESGTFTEVRRQVELEEGDELKQLDMVYSADRCYAQGHGCSVMWDIKNSDPTFIKTEFMPFYDLKQMKAAEIPNNPVFNMYYLYSADKDEIIKNLRSFANLYLGWIEGQKALSETQEYARHQDSAKKSIELCRNAYRRIVHSIDLLEDDSASNGFAWTAFRYANEAMFMQRCRGIKKRTPDVDVDVDQSKINWYPFQLAFFLQEIASFVQPDSEERRIVDLLWFPTGGGKTEAYLGISAFEIFFRRLCNPEKCDGLTIVMRYTLRLLTIQQFERASMLICACEELRRKYSIPGEEITIGLWVGNNFTPGTLDEADSSLMKLSVGGQLTKDEADPCQIKICPWCGKKMYPRNYRVNSASKRLEIVCDNAKCEFKGRPLPVRLVDEEIYEYKPTFLVATVDKFAQIAIQAKTSALFSLKGKNLPPELIIQDELHLISGPLGTMTGIYEAAITEICEKLGRPIKIVASTATIRNASKQILALYGRDYNQFPPQGLSSDNSFFAVKSTSEEKPARFYSGIMGVGTTFTTTIIRVYAAWLFASRYLVDLGYDDKVIDNFWTLTGYFNSIRELGATQTQIVDDIQSRYKYLKENKFKAKYNDYTGADRYENAVELTSRMSNDEISELIQEKLKYEYKKNNHDMVYDFVLASNMISVGVDVSRLGVMAVAGQSKTNAEYIQATSRVGRDNPGLVFTVFNAARSRDRSHYEQFSRYHSALYRYVEATSLTPFSDRARDRGLQALFVILCRYFCDELLEDNAAAAFTPSLPGVKEAERVIYKYISRVDERERDKALAELKDIESNWYDKAQTGELWYRKRNKPSLLQPDTDEGSRFRIMNSMRTVERESGIFFLGDY